MAGERDAREARYPLRHDVDLHLAVMSVRRLPFLAGLSEVDRAMLSTVVSELGSNILKYAVKGEVTLALNQAEGRPCIDIVARDQGPGIEDVHKAVQDHYSTSGTLGLGLPGVRRMMSELSITLPPEGGTQVLARSGWGRPQYRASLLPKPGAGRAGLQLEWASENRPCHPERVSGDLAFMRAGPDGVSLVLIDVSGHGASAHQLAHALEAVLQQTRSRSPPACCSFCTSTASAPVARRPAWRWSTASAAS